MKTAVIIDNSIKSKGIEIGEVVCFLSKHDNLSLDP